MDQPWALPARIETARLCLRRPALADTRSLFEAYTQDHEVCRYMVWTPHASEAATRAFIESCIAVWSDGSRRPYVIAEPAGADSAIGMIEARFLGTTVDVGYVLARSFWGRGFVPEALSALADTALGSPTIFRVQATCDIENTPSQRALEKSGFIREGRLARHTVHPNLSPEPRDCFLYAKVR